MKKSIVFVGGRPLGARCLNHLLQKNKNVVAVLCREDEYKSSSSFTTAYNLAIKAGIPVFKNEEELISSLNGKPFIGLCVMYPRKISKELLDLPSCGFYNFHGSPLPSYRGNMGHIWAIINNEKMYGASVHKMTERFDDGPLLKEYSFPISPKENGITLHKKAVLFTYKLFCQTVRDFDKKEPVLIPQDNKKATYYSKEIPNGARLDWSWDAIYIERYIRALLFDGVLPPFAIYGGKKLHIKKATPVNSDINSATGTIIKKTKNSITVQAGKNALKIYKRDMLLDNISWAELELDSSFEV